MYRDDLVLGRRRQFILRVLSARGTYPGIRLRAADALYAATESLVYSVVPAEPPNEYGWSEIAWAELGEIRLWGALALAIREGEGFFTFVPGMMGGKRLYLTELREDVADRVAQSVAAESPQPGYKLHWVTPTVEEVTTLYNGLLNADAVLLRGVNCFLKSLAIWQNEESWMLMEEMGMNLYISLEAGLGVLRRRLSVSAGRDVSFQAVYEFISVTFRYGEALVEFWQDCRDDRNILMHPDCDFGPYVIAPMSADDILELFDPMLSLYRYILIGELRSV